MANVLKIIHFSGGFKFIVYCLLFQAVLYQNGNVRSVQIFSPIIEEKVDITKSHSLLVALKAMLN